MALDLLEESGTTLHCAILLQQYVCIELNPQEHRILEDSRIQLQKDRITQVLEIC